MSATGELATTNHYWRSFNKLSPQEQREVDLAVMKFWRQPDLPGLRLHALSMQERRFHSISPTMSLRVIVLMDGEHRILMYVDQHDEAYRWAKGRRVERHEVTGSAQVVEFVETVRETVVHVQREQPRPPMFRHQADDYLLALGVPKDWLPAVREVVDDEGLIALTEHLPEEASEALLELAIGGEPTPSAPAAPEDSPYLTRDARRRFHVFSNESELARALERPWLEWAVFLHPTQRDLVDMEFTGPARVTGPAGTGKSVVAMHRAARLAREGHSVLLTTFSRVLAQRLSAGVDELLDGQSVTRARVQAQHLHAFAVDALRLNGRKVAIAEDQEIRSLLSGKRGALREARYSDSFLTAEWNAVVDYWGIRQKESYLAVQRTGRGNRLPAAHREELWNVFGKVREELDRVGKMTWGDVCEAAASGLLKKGTPPFDYVVMDEAQDFAPRELALCLQLSRRGTAGLFFAGDTGQRIYKYPFSWTNIGIDIRGRSRRLTVNYRTSSEIKSFADRLLPDRLEQIGGGEEARLAISRFSGPEPVLRACTDAAGERAVLEEWLKALSVAGVEAQDIAVLSRTNQRSRAALNAIGAPFQPLSGDKQGTVYAGTFHGAKGLEFRAVALIGCEDGQVPLAAALATEVEDEARSQAEAQERQLLYVACTRARDSLLILHRGPISRFLNEQ